METFYTLQDFFTYTKGCTYLLMIATLLCMVWFWRFLTDRDEDEYEEIEPHKHE